MNTATPATDERVDADAAGARDGSVLLPVLSASTSEFAVETASDLAENRNAELLLASTAVDARGSSLGLLQGGQERDHRRHRLADRARNAIDVPVVEHHYERTRPSRIVTEAVGERSIDIVVVERPADGGQDTAPTSAIERIEGTDACDVAVVSGEPPSGTVASILLAVAGGPHSWSAAGVARDIAAAEGAWVDVMHVLSPDAGEWRRTRGQRIMATAMDRLSDDADEWLYEADDLGDVLVEQSAYYDLIVMGAPRKSRLQQFVSGSTARAVHRDAGTAVITVRRAGHRRSLLSQLVG